MDIYEVMSYATHKMRKWSMFDLAIYKTAVISWGLLIGAYISKIIKRLSPFFWVLALVSTAIVAYKLFIEED